MFAPTMAVSLTMTATLAESTSLLMRDSHDAPFFSWSRFFINIMRAFFVVLLLLFVDPLIHFDTALIALSLGGAAGVFVASYLARTRLKLLGLVALLAAGWALFEFSFWLTARLPLSSDTTLALYNLHQHAQLIAITASVTLFSTWLFWRFASIVTLEVVGLVALCVHLLSGHRNYHFDSPKFINTLAWDFGIDQLSLLLSLGVAALSLTIVYLIFAGVSGRLNFNQIRHRRRPDIVWLLSLLITFLVVMSAGLIMLYRYHSHNAASMLANGVGDSSQEGLSPLGFHSALGSTNQPAAMVRLDGDYQGNPYAPMLYLREGALSEFNGHELVIADPAYDRDAAPIRPGETFRGAQDPDLTDRVGLTQSVYLLTEHNNAFAIDYPIQFNLIKNPNPKRFKLSYQALSLAPYFKLAELNSLTVGDPRWDEAERKHYLVTHSDGRYASLALKITDGIEAPVERAFALTRYLSQKSIYTLTPNHTVEPGQDPVAPYLFGDFRGYCVHFAHATVYMLRALGIPARIGTGYLTDLSQAKDGHILLRMSDRHAWAEVYIAGKGWTPFDTQPEQVESHADTQIDAKLLEELMQMLEPSEIILPPENVEQEPSFNPPRSFPIPSGLTATLILAALILCFAAAKLYLRFGWMFTSNSNVLVRRSYRAVLSQLHDLGLKRSHAETRNEFRSRLSTQLGYDVTSLTEPLLDAVYRRSYADLSAAKPALDRSLIDQARIQDQKELKRLPWLRRIVASINPSSTIAWIGGHRW